MNVKELNLMALHLNKATKELLNLLPSAYSFSPAPTTAQSSFARTIADPESSEHITAPHILEAP